MDQMGVTVTLIAHHIFPMSAIYANTYYTGLSQWVTYSTVIFILAITVFTIAVVIVTVFKIIAI